MYVQDFEILTSPLRCFWGSNVDEMRVVYNDIGGTGKTGHGGEEGRGCNVRDLSATRAHPASPQPRCWALESPPPNFTTGTRSRASTVDVSLYAKAAGSTSSCQPCALLVFPFNGKTIGIYVKEVFVPTEGRSRHDKSINIFQCRENPVPTKRPSTMPAGNV